MLSSVQTQEDTADHSSLTERIRAVADELQEIQNLLVSGHVDPRVLTDFRDSVNRVRTTAWAVQQVLQTSNGGSHASSAVISLLAAERIRVAYQLCRIIAGDLSNGAPSSSGNLVQLYLATADLHKQIGEALGRDSQA